MTCFFTCAATSARKWQLSQWVPNRSLLCTVKNKATKPTLTQRRSSRYKNVGVKVCWRIWACVVHLVTSVLCCWTDLSQNRGFFFVCFECINVFFFVVETTFIRQRLCFLMCEITTVEVSVASDDVWNAPTCCQTALLLSAGPDWIIIPYPS